MTDNNLAIVFPGQGSQSVGMLSDVAAQFSEVKDTFDQASNVLGYNLWSLVENGPADQLNQTAYTQPALLTASYAVWQILQANKDLMPAMLAGHSLGEYTALLCAGSLEFSDAVKLVAARGQYMQAAVNDVSGAMAAVIGLSDDTVQTLCKEAVEEGEVLSPANYNSIGQVVIAGHKAAVERAVMLAKEQGAKMAVLIPVSVPSHCSLMHPAAERLKILLAETTFNSPAIPVMNNADVLPYKKADDIRDGLVRQLYMPVRWVEIIQSFTAAGLLEIIECGPGKVLTGLNKRINKSLKLYSTSDVKSIELVMQRSYV